MFYGEHLSRFHPQNDQERARRLGQQEKNRAISRFKKLGLLPFESLVIERREIRIGEGANPVIAEVMLDARGISRSAEDRAFDIDGRQVTVRRSFEIPLEEYSRFGEVVDTVLRGYVAHETSR